MTLLGLAVIAVCAFVIYKEGSESVWTLLAIVVIGAVLLSGGLR